MSSPYDTESTSSIASASSITITSKTESTVVTPNTLRRHFCIVLTNNPRMVRSAGRMLQSVTVNMPSEQIRPAVQSPTLPKRRQQSGVQVEQQVPMSTPSDTTSIIASNVRAYEKEIEEDFQAQIQPILQMYLYKTRRSNPINSVFDMSSYVDI